MTSNGNPNFTGPGTLWGRIAAQINQYFSAKVDAEDGTADNLTLTGTVNATNATIVGALAGSFRTLTVNSNSSILPEPAMGGIAQIGNVDGATTRLELDSFGASTSFTMRRADNTNAVPAAITAGEMIGALSAYGCNGTTGPTGSAVYVGAVASIRAFAGGTGSWTSTSAPTEWRFATASIGSTTLADRWVVGGSGGLYAHGVTGGDLGVSTLNAGSIALNGAILNGADPLVLTGGTMSLKYDGNFTINGSGALTFSASSAVTSVNGAAGAVIINTANAGYFSYVGGTSVSFTPKNGNIVQIAGTIYSIPSAGLTQGTGPLLLNGTVGRTLAAGSGYFAAIYKTSGTGLAIGFFATALYGHAPDTTAGNIGVEVVTSGGSPLTDYTIIGLVQTAAGPVYQSQGLGTISWYNKKNQVISATGSSVAVGEIGTVSFVTWGDEGILWSGNYTNTNSVSSAINGLEPYIDSSPIRTPLRQDTAVASGGIAMSVSGGSSLSEGTHTFAIFQSSNGIITTAAYDTSVVTRG